MIETDVAFAVIAAFALFALLSIASALLVRGLRLDLVANGEELLADSRLSKEARKRVNVLMDTCMSFRVGLMLPVAIVACIIDDLLHATVEPSDLSEDRRYHTLVARYFASILAANPVAAMVSLPLMVVSFFVHVISRPRESMYEAAEETVEEALVRAAPVGTLATA